MNGDEGEYRAKHKKRGSRRERQREIEIERKQNREQQPAEGRRRRRVLPGESSVLSVLWRGAPCYITGCSQSHCSGY